MVKGRRATPALKGEVVGNCGLKAKILLFAKGLEIIYITYSLLSRKEHIILKSN